MDHGMYRGIALALLGWAMFGPVGRSRAAEEKAKPGAEASSVAERKEGFTLSEPVSVSLTEVPAFGKREVFGSVVESRYPTGQSAVCYTGRASAQVKKYPALKSKRPLYGSVTFDGDYFDRKAGKTYYFVLDQVDAEAAKADAEKSPQVDSGSNRLLQTKPKHDRLYFDVNGDLDLTNDGVLEPVERWSFDVPMDPNARVFGELKMTFDYGSAGKQPFAIVPRLRAWGNAYAILEFLPKSARRGEIRLGGRPFVVFLDQSRGITGRYDRPAVNVQLIPSTEDAGEMGLALSGMLGEIRTVGEQILLASATPQGDRFTLAPYRGKCGLLEVGSGGRAITKLGVKPILVSSAGLWFGSRPSADNQWPRQVRLPVGDYRPVQLSVLYGRVRFSCRYETPSRQESGDRAASLPDYPVQIRDGKPFVLQFSGKPDVAFRTPSEGQSFRCGEQVRISVMLREPSQGILITGLWDVSRAPEEKSGVSMALRRSPTLDPTITIRNAKGEQVAQGKMPFG